MAATAQRDEAVQVEVRAAVGPLDDVVDIERRPSATGLAAEAGAEHDGRTEGPPLADSRRRPSYSSSLAGAELPAGASDERSPSQHPECPFLPSCPRWHP